jgi:hypothetical protein
MGIRCIVRLGLCDMMGVKTIECAAMAFTRECTIHVARKGYEDD